jgi:hypothetical protein
VSNFVKLWSESERKEKSGQKWALMVRMPILIHTKKVQLQQPVKCAAVFIHWKLVLYTVL